jgi:hypothetical protein
MQMGLFEYLIGSDLISDVGVVGAGVGFEEVGLAVLALAELEHFVLAGFQ